MEQEQQSKLVVAAIEGSYVLPPESEMAETIVADEEEHLGHFYDSPRHRMQVAFTTYVADLHKELAAGTERVAATAVTA